VALDLPGVQVDSIDLGVERNVLTVRAERKDPAGEGTELIASERPRGVFSRQFVLGDALETENMKARYDAGVLTLRIPVAAEAKPRKIEIETTAGQQQQISA
jgi:HSP20 family protein